MKQLFRWASFFVLGGLLGGCAHTRQAQLEAVARDWCTTIRASQVIPVYPLIEDLEPGDLFLVESPIVDQKAFYLKKGYLPFENHLGRIVPTNYAGFYHGGYGVDESNAPPRVWQFAQIRTPPSPGWSNAPLAGFPSYTFTTKSSAGFQAAFPISGVPVGLSLLNARQASGSVTISSAHTYGLDAASFQEQFNGWRRQNRALLAGQAGSSQDRPRFLRLVTRVFVAEELEVSLAHSGSTSGGLDAGVAKAFNLSSLDGVSAVVQYSNTLATLNGLLAGLTEAAPGGSLRAVAASTRNITLKQRFPRPIVVGYLALEYQLLPGGDLGRAFSTRDLMEGRISEQLRAEQSRAADLVSKILPQIEAAASPQELGRIAAKAKDTGVLASAEAAEVNALAAAQLAEARRKLQELLFDFAQGGTPGNTGKLFDLLLSLQKP